MPSWQVRSILVCGVFKVTAVWGGWQPWLQGAVRARELEPVCPPSLQSIDLVSKSYELGTSSANELGSYLVLKKGFQILSLGQVAYHQTHLSTSISDTCHKLVNKLDAPHSTVVFFFPHIKSTLLLHIVEQFTRLEMLDKLRPFMCYPATPR